LRLLPTAFSGPKGQNVGPGVRMPAIRVAVERMELTRRRAAETGPRYLRGAAQLRSGTYD
jgi:hypothetical protein